MKGSLKYYSDCRNKLRKYCFIPISSASYFLLDHFWLHSYYCGLICPKAKQVCKQAHRQRLSLPKKEGQSEKHQSFANITRVLPWAKIKVRILSQMTKDLRGSTFQVKNANSGNKIF
jgi:hypothetical protein